MTSTTMSDDNKETSFKIVFGGEDEKWWLDFRNKFKAYGEYKKWWVVMTSAGTTEENEEAQQLRKKGKICPHYVHDWRCGSVRTCAPTLTLTRDGWR